MKAGLCGWIRCKQSSESILHLFAVGINKYADSNLDLMYAQPDAAAVLEHFERRGQRIFGDVRSTSLYDGEATKATILAQLSGLETALEDVVLVFFARHGTALGQMFYFLPHDVEWTGDPDEAI